MSTFIIVNTYMYVEGMASTLNFTIVGIPATKLKILSGVYLPLCLLTVSPIGQVTSHLLSEFEDDM